MGKKSKSIIESTIIVSLLSFLIKFLGLIKQAVLASYCGATEETDIFFIVTGVLVSFCIMIFSAITVSLLAIHTDTLIKEGRDKSNDLVNAVLRFFVPSSIVISLIFFLGAPVIARILAPSYDDIQILLMAKYIRQMSIIFVLWCYFSIINVILETDKEFIPGRGQNLFQNLFLIFNAIVFFSQSGIDTLILAFILSGVAECILVTICARDRFHIIWGKLKTPNSEVFYLFKLSGPLLIGNAVYELNDIVDKQISSGLGTGNVSYLTYGSTINEIVTGVVVTAIATVTFTHFATWVTNREFDRLRRNLAKCIEYMWVLIYPIMSLCIFAGDDIIKFFYGRGGFNETDAHFTYLVAIGYSLGFLFAATRSVLVRVLYAFKDSKRPLINGVISVGCNICMSILLSRFLGVWGIALATSLAMLISMTLMYKQVRHHLPDFSILNSSRELFKGLVSFVGCSVFVIILNNLLEVNVILKLVAESIVCILVYSGFMYMLKSTSYRYIFNKIR